MRGQGLALRYCGPTSRPRERGSFRNVGASHGNPGTARRDASAGIVWPIVKLPYQWVAGPCTACTEQLPDVSTCSLYMGHGARAPLSLSDLQTISKPAESSIRGHSRIFYFRMTWCAGR